MPLYTLSFFIEQGFGDEVQNIFLKDIAFAKQCLGKKYQGFLFHILRQLLLNNATSDKTKELMSECTPLTLEKLIDFYRIRISNV
jgi:hypothetical protein